MYERFTLVLLLAAVLLMCGCECLPTVPRSDFSYFTGLTDFSQFQSEPGANGTTILLSPEVKPPIHWNELIVSWNAAAPAGTWLQVEACAQLPDHETEYYILGRWSPDNTLFPRISVRGQHNADGRVATDTLVLKELAQAVQLRVTLGGTNGMAPNLKYLGLSFCNTRVAPAIREPNHAAWGRIIPTPERSQHSYPQEQGWCSPTSLSMDLARWAEVLHRPEMNLDVPEVAAKVYDANFGTGNWPFNAAFAGSFEGMRSSVSRFDDLSEVENWIAAGIPVIMSARWDMLRPGRPFDDNGHLVVCIGFTPEGDVVINDPATNLEKGDHVRHIYKRADVLKAWGTSHNTVYLVYPVGASVPPNRYHQW